MDVPADPLPPSTPREWFQLLYHELRRRARGELFRHQALTLGATTLLHEAWMRMDDKPLAFGTQAELVAYAGRVMRGIVIDHVRSRSAQKHGGGIERIPYETSEDLRAMDDDEVLRLMAASLLTSGRIVLGNYPEGLLDETGTAAENLLPGVEENAP